MINKEKSIFFLGGNDLEMQTIKKVLKEAGFSFLDNQLSWGARLSSYTSNFKEHKEKNIYGIELIEDIAPPTNYYSINHHNELSYKPSSLFQVLELLKITPSREQELISANDIGHIEAMECLGASDKEIKNIRKQERIIQGVSKADEIQAQKEIEHIYNDNGLYIIETVLDTFAPIVDNCEKRPLVVYSKKSFTYYGDIKHLKKNYKEQIEKKEAYHGRGYFGFDAGYLEKVESSKMLKEIIKMQEKKIISYHNFMFPFRFDKIVESFNDKHEFYKNNSFDDRVKIDESFKESLEKNRWEYQKFDVKNHLDYNEIVYFHDFVKDSLFNVQEFKEGATSYFFEKKIDSNAIFEIKIKNQEEPYILKLEGVNLRLFDTGVGILSFEVENYDYHKIDDILKINDYGRRVYPQFVGDGFSVEPTKGTFLPESITVNGIEDRFCDLYKEIKLAKYIIDILGDSFTTDKSKKDRYFLQPIIDDRMFLLSWYENDAFASCTKQNIQNENWYKYVFVDGKEITIQDKEMHKEFISKATYKRWNNYGTFYGITRYSFVCLSKSDFPLLHIKTMYFQMVSLLLVQRASLLRFSDEITAISDIRDNKPSAEKISILYKNYLRFVNKLYFKEITAQDQGIELYDKALDILNIKRDVEDLRQEIVTINGYAFFEQEREEKEYMNHLTKLGTIFLPGTFVAGVLGMNIYPEHFINNWKGFIVGFLAIGTITYWLARVNKISIKDFFKKGKNE